MYGKDDIELVGFSVGVVERDRLIDGSSIREGDALVGLASSGFHSNGYSLVRKVLDESIAAGRVELFGTLPGSNSTLASALLAPTRIYVKPILNVIRDFTVNGIVHITGGGFEGNVPRILPKGVRAHIDPNAWPRPPVFDWIRDEATLPESEMLRVFNCGIGMILCVPRDSAEDVAERMRAQGERAYVIGYVERREENEPAMWLDPNYLSQDRSD